MHFSRNHTDFENFDARIVVNAIVFFYIVHQKWHDAVFDEVMMITLSKEENEL
jgi:hypothetical protein